MTWLCASFTRLSVDQAALVLIHEALHTVGLGEAPRDPAAPTSDQISDLVRASCTD